MKTPKAPAPPDPVKTASAQTSTNIGTALANTIMGNVNTVGPTGSTSYKQTGSYTYRDPVSGKSHKLPTWTATTKLPYRARKANDASMLAQQRMAETASDQARFLKKYMAKPADFDTTAIEDHLYDLANPRMEQRFSDQEDDLRTRLANQGISAGSEAWEREFRGFDESRNDAYNRLMLDGRSQAFSELQARRNQPINEITALLSGSQVSMPNTAINRPAQIPTTDVAGIQMANYSQQMNNYNSKLNNRNSIMGGLFGLGAAGITGGLGLM